MMRYISLIGLLVVLIVTAGPATRASEVIRGVSAIALFEAAGRGRADGRDDDALTILRALAREPDIEIRTEARFRMGMLFSALGHPREAAETFRAILDEKPDAAGVRLELARVLAELCDPGAARRELRQISAGRLPPEVVQAVDRFAAALRSTKRLGASLELSIAPDSNINRATDARTLDTIIAPLTLDDEARAQSDLASRLRARCTSGNHFRPR